MNAFESVVVMGEAGTGKTTLINGLRTAQYEDSVVIPHRFMTRPERSDDESAYTSQLTKQAFAEKAFAGLLRPYWSRNFGEGRTEYYGYEAVGEDDERLPIFSVKNPFLHPEFRNILASGFVVSLEASATTRTDRITERGVTLEPLPTDNVISKAPDSENIVTIDTSLLTPEEGQARFRQIIDEILAHKN